MTSPTTATTASASPARTTAASISAGLLVLRLVVGAVFVAHGGQKLFEYTVPGTIDSFAAMGVPLAVVAAPAVAIGEFAGGFLLAAGFLTRPAGLFLALDMLGAIVLVHGPAGFWVGDGGFEFVAVLGAAALALALTGAGAFSLDRLLLSGRVPAWLT